eukprot:403345363
MDSQITESPEKSNVSILSKKQSFYDKDDNNQQQKSIKRYLIKVLENKHEGIHSHSQNEQHDSSSILQNSSQNMQQIKPQNRASRSNLKKQLKESHKNLQIFQEEDRPEEDQLKNEHSNSVQENLMKGGNNQSSLTNFNSSFIMKPNKKEAKKNLGENGLGSQMQNSQMQENQGRNGIFNRKLQQYHTQSNFYSVGASNEHKIKPSQKSRNLEQSNTQQLPKKNSQKQYLENMKQRIKQQYEYTNDYIKEESGEENNLYTEDEDNSTQDKINLDQTQNQEQNYDEYQINPKSNTQQKQQNIATDLDVSSGQNIINRRRQLKKNGVTPKNKQMENYNNQASPGSNPLNVYQTNNSFIGITLNHVPIAPLGGIGSSFLEKQKLSQIKHHENSYNDNSTFDRSTTNRTPLLEHYQNSGSLIRNQNHTIMSGNSSNTTSLPRPTIASELKLLKESRNSPQDFGKQVSDQFIQNSNLANFIWNKDGPKLETQDQQSNRGNNSRVRREYNIHDGSTGTAIRPITRSNQRRPVSRQVNQVDNSGINAQKLLVQQQMRNTHFGDGGFGFGAKFKGGDLSLDSERKVSRKRGTKQGGTNMEKIQKADSQVRDSIQQHQKSGYINGIVIGGGTTAYTNNQISHLNRSITFNTQNQSSQIPQAQHLLKQNTVNSYNNEVISTQESSGQHFYQANSFLNKSIESTSSRSIMISAKQHHQLQNQSKLQQINENMNDDLQLSENKSSKSKVKNKILQSLGGTQYGDSSSNVFKLVQKQQQQAQNTGLKKNSIRQGINNSIAQNDFASNQSPPLLQPIEEVSSKRDNHKIIIGASSTQSKFYSNQTVNSNLNKSQLSGNSQQHKNSRNSQIQQKNSDNDSFQQQQHVNNYGNGFGPMRSYNTTQEKFFPQKMQNNTTQDLNNSRNQAQQKAYNIKSECMMSLEFMNGNKQMKEVNLQNQQQTFNQKNLVIQKQNNQNHRIRNEMIREEQYEEISEDDDQPQRKANNDDQQSKDSLLNQNKNNSITHQQQLLQTQNMERLTNRLGGSRAFNQTRENWKDQINSNNEYTSQVVNGSNTNTGNHSLPRNAYNYTHQNYADINDLNSQKTTSSASSLTMSKQNINVGNSGMGTHSNQLNVSSISPKPNKWVTKDHVSNYTMISSNTNNNNFTSTVLNQQSQLNTSKLQEMQKEVNMMYLGGLSQKKKVSAGIKLNPIISRQQNNTSMNGGSSGLQTNDQSYQL